MDLFEAVDEIAEAVLIFVASYKMSDRLSEGILIVPGYVV